MRRYKMALRCLTVTVILLGSFTSASRAQENPCSTRGGVTTCTLNPGFVATYLLSRAPKIQKSPMPPLAPETSLY
jgi:hypothetical protein